MINHSDCSALINISFGVRSGPPSNQEYNWFGVERIEFESISIFICLHTYTHTRACVRAHTHLYFEGCIFRQQVISKTLVECAWVEDMGQFRYLLDPDTRKRIRKLTKLQLKILNIVPSSLIKLAFFIYIYIYIYSNGYHWHSWWFNGGPNFSLSMIELIYIYIYIYIHITR